MLGPPGDRWDQASSELGLFFSLCLDEPALLQGMGKSQRLFVQQMLIEHLLHVPGPITGSEDIEINESGKILPCVVPKKGTKSILNIDKCHGESKQGRGRVSKEGGGEHRSDSITRCAAS